MIPASQVTAPTTEQAATEALSGVAVAPVPLADSRELSEASKRRGLIALLLTTFFMWGGFFMVVPLISVYYVDRLGWAAASIGVVLALRQFTQQGLTLISGIMADRIGAKGLILAGLLLRVVGFASMAWASTFPLLLASALLAALGGALFESPKNAALAVLTNTHNRARFYSLSGVASGLGLTIGTQIGGLLLSASFALVALCSAACFFATFLVALVMLPPVKISSDMGELGAGEGRGLTRGMRMAFHDRPFMLFSLLLMGYWFMWVQISISLPLAAKALGGGDQSIGWIFAINSGMAILFQYPLMRLATRFLRPLPILVVGVAIMAGGLASIALVGTVIGLMVCVVFFALGSLFATPTQQTVTAELANPRALGSYFGVNSLALAIGGGLGNLCGGLLYDIGGQIAFPQLSWLVFGVVGLASATGLALLALSNRAEL